MRSNQLTGPSCENKKTWIMPSFVFLVLYIIPKITSIHLNHNNKLMIKMIKVLLIFGNKLKQKPTYYFDCNWEFENSQIWKRVLLWFNKTVHEMINLNAIQKIRFSRKVFYIKMNTVYFYNLIIFCYGCHESLKWSFNINTLQKISKN